MKPGACNLELYRGDTGRWQFRLWADAEKTTPADLAGATVAAEVRSRTGQAEAAIACTVTAPGTVDAVLAPDAWTSTPPTGGYVASWDMQIVWPGGDITTVLAGKITVSGDATA